MTAPSNSLLQQLADPRLPLDPYPVYRELRGSSPVRFVLFPAGSLPGLKEPVHAWAFLRYDEVQRAARDHESFTTEHQLVGKAFPKCMLFHDDPPRHVMLRRVVSKVFTPKRVAGLEPWIASVADELLDAMGTGQCEIVESFALPLPIKVIAALLGIPGEKYEVFKEWTDALVTAMTMPQEERSRRIGAMTAYFRELAAARRIAPEDDLITALVQSEPGGEALEEWEVVSFCMALLLGGNETTTNLVSNMLGILADRPELWRRLREDRSLVPACIEETLRYESPAQRLYRQARRDVEISGVVIPEGSLIAVCYGAANRDPAAFPEPDEFRLDRELDQHIAFGAGNHFCLGAQLARLEARISLGKFLDRFETLARGNAPAMRRTVSPSFLAYDALPLALS